MTSSAKTASLLLCNNQSFFTRQPFYKATWLCHAVSTFTSVCSSATLSRISTQCFFARVPILCNYINYSKLMAPTEQCLGPLHPGALHNTITTNCLGGSLECLCTTGCQLVCFQTLLFVCVCVFM